MTAPSAPDTRRGLRTLHLALFVGQFLLFGVLGLFASLQGPLLPDDTTLGPVFAAVGAVLVVFAVLMLRPRVPFRASHVQPEEFWRDPGTAKAVLPVWFLLEGATVLSVIGFLLSGLSLCAGVALIGILCFFWLGPGHFEQRTT